MRYVLIRDNVIVGKIETAVTDRVPPLEENELIIAHETADQTWTYDPETGALSQLG